MYSVKEMFLTLQGEGSRAGTAAVFLRFTGCNLWNGREDGRSSGKGACARWCDTDFLHGEKLSAADIVVHANAMWAGVGGIDQERWVVITGGEPTLQLDDGLLETLFAGGWKVALETNGTNDPDGGKLLDRVSWLCVSPKIGSVLVRRAAHELKVVVPGHIVSSEGWTVGGLLELAASGSWGAKYIQPMDSPSAVNAGSWAVNFVQRFPDWRLSLQTHKLIGLR
jgi:organic radical activating enzyme